MTRSLSLIAAASIAALSGCGGSCNPQDPIPEPELGCVEAAAPAGTDPVLLVGDVSAGALTPFQPGNTRQLDYGDQGGQHFYVDIRWFAPPKDALILMKYEGPNGNRGSATAFVEEACSSWFQAETYVQISEAVGETGTLTVQAGTCPPEGCAYDESSDSYLLGQVLAEHSVTVDLVP